MAGLLIVPGFMPAYTQDGFPIAGAKLYTFTDLTNTPATVYLDYGLTVAAPNPVLANAAGIFPFLYAADGSVFEVSVTDASGAPLPGGTLTGIEVSADAATGAFNTLVALVGAERSRALLAEAGLQAQINTIDGMIAALAFAGDPNTIYWEAYGATANNSAFDNYPKFVAMSAAIRARGGQCRCIPLLPNARWTVWPTGVAPNQGVILDVRGVGGLDIDFRGGVIATPANMISSPVVTYGIYIASPDLATEVAGFRIRAKFESTYQIGTRTDAGGMIGLYLQNRVVNFDYDIEMLGGLTAVTTNLTASYNIGGRLGQSRGNIRTKDVFYGYNPQFGGDLATVKIVTVNAGRSFIGYNCKDQDVMIESFGHQGGFNDCLVKCYGKPSTQDSVLSNVSINYTSRQAAGDAADSYPINIGWDQDGLNGGVYYPAYIYNLDIQVDIDRIGMVNPTGIVQFLRSGPLGTLDSTNVAHRGANIGVHGVIQNMSGPTTPILYDFFSLQSTASGANQMKIANNYIGPLKTYNTFSAGISINGQFIDGALMRESVQIEGVYTKTNTPNIVDIGYVNPT